MRVRLVVTLAVHAFTGVRLAAHDFWLAAIVATRVPRHDHRLRRRHFSRRDRSTNGAHLTRPVGLRAEFVPMTDPTILRAGHLLAFHTAPH